MKRVTAAVVALVGAFALTGCAPLPAQTPLVGTDSLVEGPTGATWAASGRVVEFDPDSRDVKVHVTTISVPVHGWEQTDTTTDQTVEFTYPDGAFRCAPSGDHDAGPYPPEKVITGLTVYVFGTSDALTGPVMSVGSFDQCEMPGPVEDYVMYPFPWTR